MNNQPKARVDEETWSKCPEGKLVDFANERRRKARTSSVLATVKTSVACLAVLFAIVWTVRPLMHSSNSSRSRLTCAQTIDLAENYFDGTLDAASRSLVEEHLKHCEECQNHYESYSRSDENASIENRVGTVEDQRLLASAF